MRPAGGGEDEWCELAVAQPRQGRRETLWIRDVAQIFASEVAARPDKEYQVLFYGAYDVQTGTPRRPRIETTVYELDSCLHCYHEHL